jgi:predicted ArsR family transcriptional regulator
MDELAVQLPAKRSDELMRAVGRRLAAAVGRPAEGDLETRVRSAVALLDSLGGAAQLEREDGNLVIRGCGGCPLSSATARRPELCRALESLLSEYIGTPVRECCDRGHRPRCHFEVSTAA